MSARDELEDGKPPENFVGFAIESKPPGGDTFFPLNNRLTFAAAEGKVNPIQLSTSCLADPKVPLGAFSAQRRIWMAPSPIASRPIFMDEEDRLSQGEPQEAAIELRRETYPGQFNVAVHPGLRVFPGFRGSVREVRQDPDALPRRPTTA